MDPDGGAITWAPPTAPPPPAPAPYVRAPPPPRGPTFFERVPARTVGFGALLFALGWLGILFQRGVLRQLVIGAPIFEELAKLGPVLVLVGLLRIRPAWARLPFGWASGAAFGVLEHFLTYSDEPALFMALRIAFHAGTCGLSVVTFTLLEPFPDARVRWASTIVSSILHAANNVGALALTIVEIVANVGAVETGYSVLVTLCALALTFAVVSAPRRAEERARRLLARLFPTLAVSARPEADPPGP
ncbi:MAG: hypothetical protein QOE90_2329 [Thermoplasmata archaeon]|nr:hypothetical protein [Thermoplasmata archaeon]